MDHMSKNYDSLANAVKWKQKIDQNAKTSLLSFMQTIQK